MIETAKRFFKEQNMKKFTCCICGCDFFDWTGCNPEPVMDSENEDGTENVCCNSCNERIVLPARLRG